MNKILFTADWHIKLGQKSVPVEWARNRYNKLFTDIGTIVEQEKISELIIGGDIFDRPPSLEEQLVYVQFLLMFREIDVDILIYSGNHEAIKKNTTFLSYLKDSTTAINPRASIVDDWYVGNGYDIIPYNRLKEFADKPRRPTNPILFTHCRGEIPPHVTPEVDLELFSPWTIVFAGDLHSHSNSQRNIVYPGSPVTTSFHRGPTDTGVIIISSNGWKWQKLDMPQLIRKTVTSTKDMVPTTFHHTIYELEGDLQEMSKVKDADLLDKKIVIKESISSLGLRPDMTIAEELAEYLMQVLLISEDKTKLFMKKFHDYI